MFEPYLADYRYYALFEDGHGMSDVGNAKGLYRSIGVYDEQKYDGHGVWMRSDGLSRSRDRDSYDSYREVSAAEVERLRQLADDRGPARKGRRDGFEGGGFAVFRREADMVDLRSAYAVVGELLPEHRFAVSLAPFEWNGLAGIVALLAARRRAEPVDGHYYFAAFESRDDITDLDRAYALIRCPSSGDGEWETYLQEGAWVLGKEPRDKVVLPVGRDDLERTIRGRETPRPGTSTWARPPPRTGTTSTISFAVPDRPTRPPTTSAGSPPMCSGGWSPAGGWWSTASAVSAVPATSP